VSDHSKYIPYTKPMPNPQLTQYIQTQCAAGVSDDAIKQALLDSGWTLADIEASFTSIVPAAPLVPQAVLPTEQTSYTLWIVIGVIMALIVFVGTAFTYFSPDEKINEARNDALDVIAKTELRNLEMTSLEYFEDHFGSYQGFCEDTQISLEETAEDTNRQIYCKANGTTFAVVTSLTSGEHVCLDAEGFAVLPSGGVGLSCGGWALPGSDEVESGAIENDSGAGDRTSTQDEENKVQHDLSQETSHDSSVATDPNLTTRKKFIDDESPVTFLLPENAFILRANGTEELNNDFLPNGKPLVRVDWGGMLAQIDTFDIGFDFHHVDWIDAYVAFAGIDATSARTIENEDALRIGTVEYSIDDNPETSGVMYLAIAGNKGYLISGRGKESDPLVDSITSTLTLSGESWGNLDTIKKVPFAERDLEFKDDFTIEERSEDHLKAMVIHNGASIAESSILLILKTGNNEVHSENVRRFTQELSDMRLEILATDSGDFGSETVFTLQNEEGGSFSGAVSTTQGGVSVSLLTPASDNEPDDWLSGKYYYVQTLRALESGAGDSASIKDSEFTNPDTSDVGNAQRETLHFMDKTFEKEQGMDTSDLSYLIKIYRWYLSNENDDSWSEVVTTAVLEGSSADDPLEILDYANYVRDSSGATMSTVEHRLSDDSLLNLGLTPENQTYMVGSWFDAIESSDGKSYLEVNKLQQVGDRIERIMYTKILYMDYEEVFAYFDSQEFKDLVKKLEAAKFPTSVADEFLAERG